MYNKDDFFYKRALYHYVMITVMTIDETACKNHVGVVYVVHTHTHTHKIN